MEIVKIVFIFTTLANTITSGQESSEPTVLQSSPSNESPHDDPLVNSSKQPGDDTDDNVRFQTKTTDDVAEVFEVQTENSESYEPLSKEEGNLYRRDIPQSLVQLAKSNRNQVQDDEEDCICHKRVNAVPVSKHINPEGNDLQRVVVYFYSKRGDPKVQLYIPDVQKQHFIPDLPLEDHDLLQPLDSEVLLDLFINSPFSVTKTYFDTRPDYTVKQVAQPDVYNFRRVLIQLLVTKPRTFESLIRLIKSKSPKPSRNTLLTILDSLDLNWDELVEQLKNRYDYGEVYGYGPVADSPHGPQEHHTVEVPSHENIPHEEDQIVPSYQVQNNVVVPSYVGNFVPIQKQPQVLPSFVNLSENNIPAPVLPTHVPEPIFPTYRPSPEPYDEPLSFLPSKDNVPTSKPIYIPQYDLQPESQVSYPEYPEFDPYDPQTGDPVELHPVRPNVLPKSDYQYYDFPTNSAELPLDAKPYPKLPNTANPARPNKDFPAEEPLSHAEDFPISSGEFPQDAKPYPKVTKVAYPAEPEDHHAEERFSHAQDFPTSGEFPAGDPVGPQSVGPQSVGPNELPTTDYQYYDFPNSGEYPLDAKPYSKIPYVAYPAKSEGDHTADGPFSYEQNQNVPTALGNKYQWEDIDPPYPFNSDPIEIQHPLEDPDPQSQDYPDPDGSKYQWEDPYPPNNDGLGPTGSKYPLEDTYPDPTGSKYPWEGTYPDPANGKYTWEDPYPPNKYGPYPTEGNTPWEDLEWFPQKFPVYVRPQKVPLNHKEPIQRDFNVQSVSNNPNTKLNLQPQRPFGPISWENRRPQYEVEYSRQPDSVLIEQLRNLLLQPQSLDLIIKYLKKLRDQPDYVINRADVQDPDQLQLTVLQRLLNPGYSYVSQPSQQRREPERLADPTFDQWFQGQVVDLGNKFGEINVDSLKVLIEGILRDHDLVFTKEGVLINKLGNTLNIGELKLRPILIGNSVDVGIKTLLEDAVNKKIKIAHDSPYLHGLLVSLGTPPHVLGLVPLGYKSPNDKLPLSDKFFNKPEKHIGTLADFHALGPLESQIQGLEAVRVGGGATPWSLPGHSKVYSWTSPIQKIRYRPQIIRKTFKNVPLDRAGFQKALTNLKLSGLGKARVTVARPGLSRNYNLDQGLYGDDSYEVSTGLPPRNSSPSPKGPQLGLSPVGSLSLNAGLPSLNAYGKRGLDFGANLDSSSHRFDLGQLGGILGSLPSLVTSNALAGVKDKAQLNGVADLVLNQSGNLGVPDVQLSEGLGADVKKSLDGLLSSRGDASVNVGSKVKVPAGVGKDFEFTEYPVQQAHAAADAPEFRIIGGNAATGSGTPLSNKGKSGPVVL